MERPREQCAFSEEDIANAPEVEVEELEDDE
jgi:hypothetical protein